MRINTTRFGEIDIDDKRIIRFSEGLLGFPQAHRFVILEHAPNNPFHWLQNLDDPSLAFVVMDPLIVAANYRETIPEEALKELGIPSIQEAVILTIVTIDREKKRVTTNLLGPLLIHPTMLRAKQLILEGSAYSTKHDIASPPHAQQKKEASVS